MKKLTAVLILVFLSRIAFGQKDTTMRLTIKQAVDYALEHQHDILNAKLDVGIARSKVNETIGIGLPQINGSFDLKDYEQIPTSLVPAEFFGGQPGTFAAVQFGTRWNATAGISASQLIFDPSYIVGVNASKTYRELSEKNLNRTRIETAVEVTKAYYTLLVIREREKVIQANVARLDKLYKDTKALFDNGFVEKVDLDRVLVTFNNIKAEEDRFGRLVDLSMRTLKFQMGLPESATVVTVDSLDANAVKNLAVSSGAVDPTSRIEYSLLKTQERLQEYNIKRYKGLYLPSLVAYGSLVANAQRTEFNIFNSDYRWYPIGFIGATLNLKIFDGFQRSHQIRQEKYALEKVKNDISNFENAVTLEVSNNRASLTDALAGLQVQEENLDLANSVAKTSKLKYEQGVGSNLEVLDAETSLKEAQVNYFNALYQAIIAKINLEKSLGNFKY